MERKDYLVKQRNAKRSPARMSPTVPESSIVSLDSLELDLEFGKRRSVSPYRLLLEQLLDAPRNSALKINSVKSRYSIIKQARALGYRVVFAEYDQTLYVKIDGILQDSPPPVTRTANLPSEEVILRSLSGGPKTVAELGRDLNVDPAACASVLTRLVKEHLVERDAGLGRSALYRANAKAKG